MPVTFWDVAAFLPRKFHAGVQYISGAIEEYSGVAPPEITLSELLYGAPSLGDVAVGGGVYPQPAMRYVGPSVLVPIEEWAVGYDFEVEVFPGVWLPETSRGAQIVLGRVGLPRPTYGAGEVDVLAKYGPVSAVDEPAGVLWAGQPYVPVVGPASAVAGVYLASEAPALWERVVGWFGEESQPYQRVAETRLAALRTEAQMIVDLPGGGSVQTEPSVPSGYTAFQGGIAPTVPETPPSAVTGGGGVLATAQERIEAAVSSATAGGGAVTGAGLLAGMAAMFGIGRVTGNGATAAAATAAGKAALTQAMLAAGFLPLDRRSKYPRRWWHVATGRMVTLPKKRRARGISGSEVKTVNRVHRKFKSIAKSLGYMFKSGGRGTVSARGTKGRYKRK